MSSELRLKKLRGSGGYVMASVTDEQQMKGNLGGPDLFLAPIGRLDAEKISKHFCNTCEKEFEGSPKIEFENPNEEVAENLILAERGQYICNSCNSSIAEYRDFKKQDEAEEVGNAKPLEQTVENPPQQTAESTAEIPQETVTQPGPATAVSTIEGRAVYDENANKIGIAKQVGIDSTQSMVLVITKNDGTEGSIPWSSIKKIGDVILLGNPEDDTQPGKCTSCGFVNKQGSKFCEECGTKL
ncbi:MAG: PRC-barrel domain-containing protein [Nitrosopumilus sp.]|nr:PRC-barrel domain-containing protein [Nitrosopumilus sp.]MDH3736833.1 PRC-barrel domain-containing protein [Nitrosopumilus sp.]MDH3822758.1 PRC-barrel domain-containing protein [Nitrosopumilus sp.]MDH3834485.1 PRC-barrel domain-containing protein [Nitrosopumilus sp.]